MPQRSCTYRMAVSGGAVKADVLLSVLQLHVFRWVRTALRCLKLRYLAAGPALDSERAGQLRYSDSLMVPRERLELSRCYQRRILNPLRLPIPPSRHSGGAV